MRGFERIGPIGLRMVVVSPDKPDQEDELLPDRAADVGAHLGLDPRSSACVEKCLSARRASAVVLAENQLLHGAGMANDARLRDLCRDVAGAAHHRALAQDIAQDIVLADAVLQRNDRRSRADERSHSLRCRFGIPELDSEQDQVDRPDIGRIVGRSRGREMHVAQRTLDLEAAARESPRDVDRAR